MNNREIKFRAWNGKKMNYEPLVSTYDASVNSEFYFSYSGQSNLEFMQYTGLKDKNCKEIYEGDIVKWDKDNHYNNCGGNCNTDRIEVVKYNEYGFEPFIYSDGYNGVIMIDYNYCEVIGNIYENQELL